MSGLDLTFDPERQPRRFEVINGAGGRRQWSVDDKARIIAETLEPNAIVSEVARRFVRQQELRIGAAIGADQLRVNRQPLQIGDADPARQSREVV